MAKRRILKAEIKYLSLCPRGMNRLPVIYKADEGSDDGALDLDMMVKSDDLMEKGELLAVVYAPENRDKEGDIASAAVIKEMMYNAAKNGLSIDIRHDEKALKKDQAYVAESFLIQKGDPRFADFKDYDGNKIDVTGAWATVVKIEDNELKKLYKEGKWNGVSMGGRAKVEIEKSDSRFDQILKDFARHLNRADQGDDEMTEEQLQKLNKGFSETLAPVVAALTVLTAGMTEAKKEEKKPEVDADAPVFKGDATKLEDVEAHKEALEIYQLRKATDFSKLDQVVAFQKAMADRAAKKAGAQTENTETKKQDGVNPQITALEKQLADLKKASNQSAGTPNANVKKNDDLPDGLSKEDADNMMVGQSMAKFINAVSDAK